MSALRHLAAALLTVALLLPAGAALACGGFFCSAVNLIPIEQNAERLLFEVDAEADSTAMTVDISYTGDPDDFSWVLPVPDTPELALAEPNLLALLDSATAPTLSRIRTTCSTDGGGGCAAAPSNLSPPGCNETVLMAGPWDAAGGSSGDVVVEELPRVGPYESDVVSSDDPTELIGWLNDNDFLITPEMEPFVAGYVTAGMKFLAMKMAPDAELDDVAPVQLTLPGTTPMIPLSLTAVAAEPDMAVIVLIAAEGRYQAASYANALVDSRDVRSDPTAGQSNYNALISWLSDGLGGRVFFTEYAGSSFGAVNRTWNLQDDPDFEAAFEQARAVAERSPYLTRMYARISPWEIDSDPLFEPGGGGDISNVLDLSANPPVDTCLDEPPLGPCGDTYCGSGALCASTDGWGAGCVCPEGTVARVIRAPGQDRSTVSCMPLSHDMMGSVADMGLPGQGVAPCALVDCGAGECVALNGFATCACDDGYAAVTGPDGAPLCVPMIDTWGPDALLATPPTVEVAVASGEAGRPLALAGLLVLALPGLLLRRSRRR